MAEGSGTLWRDYLAAGVGVGNFQGGVQADIRSSGSGIQAAALQVAIWEAIYDPLLDLSMGSFNLVTSAGVYGGQATALAIFNQASTYLTGLAGASYASSSALWLETAKGQDQITSVPEPAALMLLGLGSLAIAGFARARAQASRAIRGASTKTLTGDIPLER
jgi:hypothetical protein